MRWYRSLIVVVAAILQAASPGAQHITQSRGVDQRVDYRSLERFGPWDDRNYQVRHEDLKLLAPNEEELIYHIPTFFRIELRKEFPDLPRTGPSPYPRAARQLFEIRYGGLMQDGKLKRDPYEGQDSKASVPVNGEMKLNEVLGANEVTVEINPVFPDRVIAGANVPSGQEMYYSANGGQTWSISGVLPSTCCDPTVGWSSDGTTAYAAALSNSIGVSFYRSTDFGVTWGGKVVLTSSGSDKEFLHVDISPTSPFKDNIYLTYHNNNVMQFAKSTDLGLTFTKTGFTGTPGGIGSDITTDSAGNIYYLYAATAAKQIILRKSTDGGASFAAPFVVANTNGSFDWPIPAMETRRAWIYAATDADRSTGPFAGSVYVSWTDTTGPESGTAANNHTQVKVAYSRDGGATWSISIPHPIADVNTVDRFNQWITVDFSGVVHVVYYDTQHSVNRSGVDFYYTFSIDGGVTWNTPERVSPQTSANLTDSQEWGDYNGVSVLFEKVIPVWTDNRDGPPNSKDVYAADLTNIAAEPTFLLGGSGLTQEICVPGDLAEITLDITGVGGFSNPVTLGFDSIPSTFSGEFSGNPVTPNGQSFLNLSVASNATWGEHQIVIGATAEGTGPKQIVLSVIVARSAPGRPTLLLPMDGETMAGSGAVTLAWEPKSGANSYRVQVSDTPSFSAPLEINQVVVGATHEVTGLTKDTTYYWRVASINVCGRGSYASPFSFFTDGADILLVDGDGDFPDVQANYTDVLDALGAAYDVHDLDTDGTPEASLLAAYDVVIWFTGGVFSGPSQAQTDELGAYVVGGGKLFLCSQDYLFDFGGVVPPFAQNTLGLASYANDGGNYSSVTGTPGSIFEGLGPFPLVYTFTDFSDALTPGPSASTALIGNNGNGAAIVTADTVFFAFPLTALVNNGSKGTSGDAEAVMQAILDYLNPPDPPLDPVWVQFSHTGVELGTESQPFNTLQEGVNAAIVSGTVNIKAGSSSETGTFSTTVHLNAPTGTVQIGASP